MDEKPAHNALVKSPAAPLPLSDALVYLKQIVQGKLIKHIEYIEEDGQDLPEIWNWKRSNPQ